MSINALKKASSFTPVLGTFNPRQRAVRTREASGLAVAAIPTQPDNEGQYDPVTYESSKLTVAERNYPALVLDLVVVVHALQVFKHYLLGSGASQPDQPADGQPDNHVAQDEQAPQQGGGGC